MNYNYYCFKIVFKPFIFRAIVGGGARASAEGASLLGGSGGSKYAHFSLYCFINYCEFIIIIVLKSFSNHLYSGP